MSTDAQPSAADRQGIQVIARAASILRAVGAEARGLSLGELAARLGLARSTVQRIVGALVEEGLLMSAGARAGVTLGPALIRLAAAAIVDTEKLARPVLQSLSTETGETVDLSVLRDGHAVFVEQVVGTSRLVAISAVGAAFPLHCTANGKALLTRVPPERRAALLGKSLKRYTPRTITSLAELERDLAEAARSGLTVDIEEHAEGICAVGAVFTDQLDRAFAISIPMPSSRFAARRDESGRALLCAVAQMRSLLGQAPA